MQPRPLYEFAASQIKEDAPFSLPLEPSLSRTAAGVVDLGLAARTPPQHSSPAGRAPAVWTDPARICESLGGHCT